MSLYRTGANVCNLAPHACVFDVQWKVVFLFFAPAGLQTAHHWSGVAFWFDLVGKPLIDA